MSGVAQSSLGEWVGNIWAEVIGTDPPRPSDTFTDLGGHSVHALRVVHRLREGLGIPVPLAVIFDTTDLADLCRWLAAELVRLDVSPAIPGTGS
jgi:hypothetical protein